MPQLPFQTDDNLLVGTEYPDDAAVYRMSTDLALIQTVDFFPPVVDDPYRYGQIAAANALSDVYAMGGRPLTAMNIVCFPCKALGNEVLVEILKGGGDKVKESGALLVGGHTINDQEPKYGLAVTGVVHPGEIWTKGGGEPGDVLILTKPLGSGIITTAHKADMVSAALLEEVTAWMAALNKDAAEIGREFGISTCTDITGFGLLGHAYEMIAGSEVGITFFVERLPVLEGVIELAEQGLIPGGAQTNKQYLQEKVTLETGMDDIWLEIMCDPQTSGGLLMAVKQDKAAEMIKQLQSRGITRAAIVGEVTADTTGLIQLQS